MQAATTLHRLAVHYFTPFFLRYPNSEVLLWHFCIVHSNAPQPSLLHHLTSTTLTFESNSSSPLAHSCLTKDNPHRSPPALCLLSSVITAVPANHRLLFFFLKRENLSSYFKLCHHWPNVKYLQQSCERMCVCAFLHQGKCKKKKMYTWVVLWGIAFCHPVQEQTKVINAPCERISVLCKTKQYRIVWMH